MSDWPKVWVLFATYKRTETALGTIESLREHLHYPNLHYHICDDGSGNTDDGTDRWHVGVLADAFAQFYPEVTWHEMDTPAGHFDTGGSINRGIRAARANGCDIYMLNFDDWALLRDLDLRPMVDVLDTHKAVGFIRLTYLVPGLAALVTAYKTPRLNTTYMWLRLVRDWSLNNGIGAQEPFLVSTQPYVAHVRFHNAYGWHPEHCTPGRAEEDLVAQYNYSPHMESGPQILSPIGPEIVHAPWGHMVGRANDYAKV